MLRYCNGFSRSNSFGAAGDDCGRCAGAAETATVSASTRRRTKLMRDALNVFNIRMGSFTLSLEKEGLRLRIIPRVQLDSSRSGRLIKSLTASRADLPS